MSFSIKRLFVGVALAAIFVAAFVYQSEWWTIGIVTLTLAVLVAATLGLSLRLLKKPFWLTFCILGWTYFVVAFSSTSLTRLPTLLPSTRVAFEIWIRLNAAAYETRFLQFAEGRADPRFMYSAFVNQSPGTMALGGPRLYSYYVFLDLVQCLSTLLFATLAGVTASYCVRRSASASSTACQERRQSLEPPRVAQGTSRFI